MSDWIPAPKIENALIILMDIPDLVEDYSGFAPLPWLEKIADQKNNSPYLYHERPDAGEIFEETLPDLAENFALLAQLPGNIYNIMFSGFRRIFSRVETKRAIVLTGDATRFSPDEIQKAFDALDNFDILLNVKSDDSILLGMNAFYQEIFQTKETTLPHLRKLVEGFSAVHSLKTMIF